MQFLAQNVRYPKIAAENGVQGRVLVQFVIEKNGSCSNYKIVRSATKDIKDAVLTVTAQNGKKDAEAEKNAQTEQETREALDAEALRVLHAMPNWIPAKQRGQEVRMRYTLPITFRLQ